MLILDFRLRLGEVSPLPHSSVSLILYSFLFNQMFYILFHLYFAPFYCVASALIELI